MKIILKDGDKKLILSDAEFDTPGFTTLVIEKNATEYEEIDIHIEDLYPAVVAFLEKYNLDKE